ncbi:hypothetical protein Acor_82530 [Acrocarpospora corrugata]|uniref:Aminoglycoside phosphotransferase domain-containing protein n=1 Tax=Acrocarpospora corrugata TaxID=35763 RepID=A0A5M3WB64_9ACTN|nr:phosphotransferase [Acrocarpospora corrugata]GES06184.1 hypothetical protein Acor_82530 [Acrocarpospora corrugata]
MSDADLRLRYLDEVIPLLFPPSARMSARTLLPHRLVPRRLVPRAHWHVGGRVLVGDGPDTIETYLTEVLGQRVHTVLHVRPARRANRKPILEAYGAGGLVGFVKVGDSARARELVRHEAATLRSLTERPLKVVVPPTVLHFGEWRELDVLVLSPLPVTGRKVRPALLAAAVTEIAALDPAGAWHGDFSPWNMAAAGDGRLLVWDWERFGAGVPLGFDALHHFFQSALRRMRPAPAAHACVARAGRTLEPFGLSFAEARLTAAHYLITQADRHRRDGHEPLGPASTWLNPVLDQLEVLP